MIPLSEICPSYHEWLRGPSVLANNPYRNLFANSVYFESYTTSAHLANLFRVFGDSSRVLGFYVEANGSGGRQDPSR